jgi:hypothetical protein
MTLFTPLLSPTTAGAGTGSAHAAGSQNLFRAAPIAGRSLQPADRWLRTGRKAWALRAASMAAAALWLSIVASFLLLPIGPAEAAPKQWALVVKAAPRGSVETTSSEFVDIPGLSASLATAAESNLAITVSATAETSFGAQMFVRALVDDEPAGPDDVVFAASKRPHTSGDGPNSFTFVKQDLTAGIHTVRVQWRVDSGKGTSWQRTLTLRASPEPTAEGEGGLQVAVAPSGPDEATRSPSFVDIPDLSTAFVANATSNLAITVSGGVETSRRRGSFRFPKIFAGWPFLTTRVSPD